MKKNLIFSFVAIYFTAFLLSLTVVTERKPEDRPIKLSQLWVE